MREILENIYGMTAINELIAQPGYLIMILLGFVLLYLGIKK